MHTYPDNSMEKVSELLERSAHRLGASAFSIKNEIVPLHVALDAVGPLCWALTLHAHAINQLLEPSNGNLALSVLPFVCISNPDAPFSSEVVMQPSGMAISTSLMFLDTCLEHSICTGMQSLGYKPTEWDALPDEQKVVPIEPYYFDLQENWINEAVERGGIAEQINAWPQALDRETLEHLMTIDQIQGASRVLRFPSAR